MRDASQVSGGYVRLYRSLLEWEWFQNSPTLHVFLFLLLSACFRPIRHAGVELAPGQLITARRTIAQRTGLSEQQVRTALAHLKSTGEITSKSTSHFSLITLNNYARYQGMLQPAVPPENQPSVNQPPANRQPNKKNDNHVNHEKKKGVPPHVYERNGYEHSGHERNRNEREGGFPALGVCV